MEGVAIANQEVMFLYLDLDVEVTRSATTGSHFTTSRKMHPIAVVDSGWDLDLYIAP
jgi:hypothetical protein